MVLSPTSELHHNRQMNLHVKQTAHNRLGGMMWAVWPASCQKARRRLS